MKQMTGLQCSRVFNSGKYKKWSHFNRIRIQLRQNWMMMSLDDYNSSLKYLNMESPDGVEAWYAVYNQMQIEYRNNLYISDLFRRSNGLRKIDFNL